MTIIFCKYIYIFLINKIFCMFFLCQLIFLKKNKLWILPDHIKVAIGLFGIKSRSDNTLLTVGEAIA